MEINSLIDENSKKYARQCDVSLFFSAQVPFLKLLDFASPPALTLVHGKWERDIKVRATR